MTYPGFCPLCLPAEAHAVFELPLLEFLVGLEPPVLIRGDFVNSVFLFLKPACLCLTCKYPSNRTAVA